jgi:K(+)-stimulated pyrophosphate-energized sodium pump
MNEFFLLIPLLAGIAALAYAAAAFILMRRGGAMDSLLEENAALIRGYTFRFIKKEYLHIGLVLLLLALSLFFLKKGSSRLVVLSFLLGGVGTGISGVAGVFSSTYANAHAACAARSSTLKALKTALRGGSVVGFTITGISLIFLSALLFVLGRLLGCTPADVQCSILPILFGYALGAGIFALMGRVNGGIFAKAADISADLVGKVENDMEEDDPRNPAVTADTVGDNVNDIAGMSLDLSESYTAAILGAMLVGGTMEKMNYTLLPLVLAASGVLMSMTVHLLIKMPESGDPQKAISKGGYRVSFLILLVGLPLVRLLVHGEESFELYTAYSAGVLSGVAISFFTGRLTSRARKPVMGIAAAAQGGVTPSVTEGLMIGTGSVVMPVLLVSAVLYTVYGHSGLFGITLAALGILSATAVQTGIDASGPITDNAGALVMLDTSRPVSRERTDKLGAAGNSFNAVGKGYAVVSAAFASIALFVVYTHVAGLNIIDLTDFKVLIGVLLGSAFPFLFTSVLLRGVNRVMSRMIVETRRILEKNLERGGFGKDDLEIDLLTTSGWDLSLFYMYCAGGISIFFPPAVWFLGGAAMLGGVLVGIMSSGTMLAVMMNNAGGSWDNAKKHIASGAFGGKHTATHRSAIISDSIGDPLKDLAGPSMDILMKLAAVEAIILAGV